MLIDDVIIQIIAGKGGKGAVAFDSNKMGIGPTGARGGDGGSVYFEGISDLSGLQQFRYKKDWEAKNGEDGRSQWRDGHVGTDRVLKVPVGTVIHNLESGQEYEITKIGQRILGAKGGRGGKGNFFFRSPKNTSPTEFQPGLPGETFKMHLELKLIADVGFVGYPNVGKSSLLNELTRAQAKVANYPFTTLEPNLGVYYDLILADIPGLIEGASAGKGLGFKFLRHIERTKTLFHIIAADSKKPVTDYKTIRKELGAYNKELLKKKELLFIGKSDLVSAADLKKKLIALKKLNKTATAFSIHDLDSIEKVKKALNKIAEQKRA